MKNRYHENPKDKGLKFPRKIKIKATRYKKPANPESEIQVFAENFCKMLGYGIIRIPDAIYWAIKYHPDLPEFKKAQMLKYIKSQPDLGVYKADGKYNKLMWLELKSTAGRMSPGQKEFAERCNVEVSYGMDETEKAIKDFHKECKGGDSNATTLPIGKQDEKEKEEEINPDQILNDKTVQEKRKGNHR